MLCFYDPCRKNPLSIRLNIRGEWHRDESSL
jgi:hypothetical protein